MKSDKLEELIKINIALSREKSIDKLLEKIVILAMEFTNADGGTLYIKDEEKLRFKVVKTRSLNIKLGGYSGEELNWPPLSFYKNSSLRNRDNISVECAFRGEIINIKDVYKDSEFNFEGAKSFDKSMNYHTQSMLVIPLKDVDRDVIGVLQLINKHEKKGDFSSTRVEFDSFDENLATALASQATISITNARLINELESFMHGFIESIGKAIDEKSPYTGGHVKQVGKITKIIAEAVNRDQTVYKDVYFDDDELNTLEMAAWLHDVGKIAVPEHIMDKATKLEKVTDRIEIIRERIEILKRDFKIKLYEKEISRFTYYMEIAKLTDDLIFLENVNIGGEYLPDEDILRIEDIAKREYQCGKDIVKLLRDDEIENLSIKKGTLLQKEKDIIMGHAKMTLDILEKLPIPKKYSKLVHIASNHHETLNGKGYPRGLKDHQLTIEDRILAIADIFDALTAHDRPYKKPKKLSEAFKILSFMVKDNHLDGDLVRILFQNGTYRKYVDENLFPEQIDEPALLF